MSVSVSTRPHVSEQQGFSLLETVVALSVLLIVAAGVLPLGIIAFATSENHGHLSARAAEYAQDKLEQLMALSYGDAISDTRVFPAVEDGGSGLTQGGSVDPDAPVDLNSDYLSAEGALLPSVDGVPPDGWYYQRLWLVEEVGAPDANCPIAVSAAQICLKRITVMARVRTPSMGGVGIVPRATVTALKTYPF